LKKYKLQKDNIDKFIEALEEMIDARDDIWQEEKFCNYRQAEDIRDKRYFPARKQLRKSLYNFIAEVIEEEEE
jgi:hypothetical protein